MNEAFPLQARHKYVGVMDDGNTTIHVPVIDFIESWWWIVTVWTISLKPTNMCKHRIIFFVNFLGCSIWRVDNWHQLQHVECQPITVHITKHEIDKLNLYALFGPCLNYIGRYYICQEMFWIWRNNCLNIFIKHIHIWENDGYVQVSTRYVGRFNVEDQFCYHQVGIYWCNIFCFIHKQLYYWNVYNSYIVPCTLWYYSLHIFSKALHVLLPSSWEAILGGVDQCLSIMQHYKGDDYRQDAPVVPIICKCLIYIYIYIS